MQNRIELRKNQIDYLINLPEHGMGYQLVEIRLNDGQVLKNRTVVNATYLILEENEILKSKDIESIKVEPYN